MRSLAATYRLYPPRAEIPLLNPGDWCRNPLSHPALWAGFGLGLTLLLVYGLTGAGFTTSQPFRPDDLRDEPALLDSFSEPSVACAILRQEAERLLLVYRDNQHWEKAPQPPRKVGGAELAAQPGTGEMTDPMTASGKRSGPQASSIQSLSALDAQVQDVQLSLSRKLLLVYREQHLWNEFLDRYLQLVREGPGRRDVVVYLYCALECSQKCGRAEEVLDVLQHIFRFHPDLNTVAGLKEVLAKWKTEGAVGLEVSQQ